METRANRLRQACNSCHASKVRCSGGEPCERCRNSGIACQHSYMSKLGKPKGSRNKRTLEKAAAKDSAQDSQASNVKNIAATATISPSEEPDPLSRLETSGVIRAPDMSIFDTWLANEMSEFPEGLGVMSTSDNPSMHSSSTRTSDLNNGWENSFWYLDTNSARPQSSIMGSEDLELDDHQPLGDGEQRNLMSMPNGNGQFLHPIEEHLMDALVPTTQASESAQRNGDRTACSCLRTLADLLCHLNMMEHKHESMSVATTLSEADATRKCAETVLECHCCRLDLKVAMLITTVLQTALDWLSTSQRRSMHTDQTPKVLFGTWTIPESDATSVRKLLTYRILTTSDVVVNNLRLRMDEITCKASKSGMSSKFMDTKYLQQALRRLAESLRELIQQIRN